MTHPQIEGEEVVERYVRNQLPPAERQAFEEHFFSCDECFERVQATERFVAGVRDAAAAGQLDRNAAKAQVSKVWPAWLAPAFAASACAAAVLAAVAAWMLFVQTPRMRRELARLSAGQQAERGARASLEEQFARQNEPEANLPLVMLQATRDVQSPPVEIALPSDAGSLVLWIDVAGSRYSDFRLQVESEDKRVVATVEHLRRNSYGALAASLPAQHLQDGTYRITLRSEQPLPESLVGEYRLRIRRP